MGSGFLRACSIAALVVPISMGAIGCALARQVLQEGSGSDATVVLDAELADADELDAASELDSAADDSGDRDARASTDAGVIADVDAALGRDVGPPIDAGRGDGRIDLRSAAGFAVLAGAMVVSTGFTVIHGDLGISPSAALVGFPPGIVMGTIHGGDAIAAQAKLDLTAAYDDAAGRTGAPITVAGNLGGRTLAPGLYTSATTLEISTGDLTLDADGDANAVWIFQMGTAFAMTAGCRIILVRGARAANVFWQVGSSATFGAAAVIVGNFMADQSITIGTGASLEGRALARIASVTLAGNVITLPMP